MRSALIAGGSGLVGSALLAELLAAADYTRVVAVGRQPLAVAHPKLEQRVVDFAALDRTELDLAADDVFCCLGTTLRQAGSREQFRAVDHGAVLALAWAAQRQGARRFVVVSALGADPASGIFYNRVKGETEEALMVLGFSSLVILRPSLLRGARAKPRVGERFGSAALWLAEPLLVGRWRKYRAIEAGVVARAMRRVALADTAGVRVILSDEIQELGGFDHRR